MIPVDVVGYIGGFFIMISFLPQVIKSYRTKSVEDLSLTMLLASFTGTIFWWIYGYMTKSLPILVTNIIFNTLCGYQIYLKVHYDKKS